MKIYLVLVFTSENDGTNQNAVDQHEAALLKEYILQNSQKTIASRIRQYLYLNMYGVPISHFPPHGINDKPDKPYGLKRPIP